MAKEPKDALKTRTRKITSLLKKRFPQAQTRLHSHQPIEMLVATILSAQCTDNRVNIVTQDLFKKYKNVKDFAQTSQATLEKEIRSTGFYRNKAKSIREASAKILGDFGGRVPRTLDELLSLPGVARKTANCVLGNAFGLAEGVVVDTHVARLSIRLGFTKAKKANAVKIEKDLMAIVPKKDWIVFSHLLIHHGRATCTARKPDCESCLLNKLCPSAFKV